MELRLTEEQLKNTITEAVKQILTELDFQTYADVAHKRLKQANDRTRPFKNKKGYTKQDLQNRATDLMRHTSDMRDQQFGIGKFRPEDEEEYQKNLTKAAIHHMAFMQNFDPSSKLSREWDPYTKKYEINGLDVLKRRRDASENYHNHSEDVFDWAQGDLETDEDGTRPSNIYRPFIDDYHDEDDEYYELTDDEYMRGDMYHPDEIKNNLQYHHL